MKQNMSSLDRIIRTVIAIILLALSLTGVLTGVVATIGIIFAVIFLLTAAVGLCPLYLPFKFSTKKL